MRIIIRKRGTVLNIIIESLNLKTEDVVFPIEKEESATGTCFIITLKKKIQICPHCSSPSTLVKGYRKRKIYHKIFEKWDVDIFYNARRFVCPNCRKSFMEKNTFGNKDRILTASLIDGILNDLKPFNSTFSSTARKYGVSVTTAMDIFDKHVQIPRKPFTSVLCWDEFYFTRRLKYKYAFTILDFKKKVILDIVESRHEDVLIKYFHSIPLEEREKVEFIIIDMYKTYKTMAKTFFKNAKICIDPFHISKRVNDSVNSQRKYVMRKKSVDKYSKEYLLLKHYYKLLLKNMEDIEVERKIKSKILGRKVSERELLDLILEIDENLKLTYRLKERFIEFNNSEERGYFNREEKESELDLIIKAMFMANIRPLSDCAKTLRNWKDEILNSFVWIDGRRLSNGPIEGRNAYIKKIIGNANGLNNFERARNKFMYSQNLYEQYSLTEHKKKIKREGSKRGPYKKN